MQTEGRVEGGALYRPGMQGVLGSCWHSLSCWAQWPGVLGCAARLRRTHGLFPWCSFFGVWYLPLPTLGVGFINILSLLHFSAPPAFLLFSGSPKQAWGLW